ncbi:MAG: putative Se/S carrier-like protein [candidate division WOR-3 bacterium]
MTNDTLRDGTPRSSQSLTAIAFKSIHTLMGAAHYLKKQGFDVLVAPRRDANCGAVVLIAFESVTAALTALKAHNITPEAITDYPLTGGVR